MTPPGWTRDPDSFAGASSAGARPGNGRGDGRAARVAAEVGKPIGALFRDVIDKIRGLVREELRLAKAEVREQLELAGRNLVWIGAGAGLALAAVLILCFALNRGLTVMFSQFMSPEIAAWLVPLLLGVVLAAAGGALIAKGIRTLREHFNLVPDKTMQTLKEDREWLRQKVT
jgi:uncharacterized integral membrane protein